MYATIFAIIFLMGISSLLLILFLYIQQSRMIFYPEALAPEFDFQFKYPFEELFLKTSDGKSINALHFHCEKPKGIVFYAHGNAGSLRDWGLVAEDFINRDYELFIYDYRGYGKSKGKIKESLLHQDAEMLYKHLLQNFPEDKIVLYGRSLGSGIMCALATKVKPRLLILETPFYNLVELAASRMPSFLVNKLLKFPFRNDLCMSKLQCPFHIFHGMQDQVAPFEHSQRLINLTDKVEAEVLTAIGDGNHNDLSAHVNYQKQLDLLLDA